MQLTMSIRHESQPSLRVQLLSYLVPQSAVAFCEGECGQIEDPPGDTDQLESVPDGRFRMFTMNLAMSTSGGHTE